MFLRCHLSDKQRVRWALLGITALFGVLYWRLYADSVPTLHIFTVNLDFKHVNIFSEEYFTFLTDKPNGYPVFLFLINRLAQSEAVFIHTVILFQLVLFLLSAGYLSVCFYDFSERKFLSFLLLLLILGNPEIIKFCFLVMTESFMMSLLMLILGLGCRWVMQTNIQAQHRTLILLSLCLGVSILVRPICYAWIIAVVFAMTIFYGRPSFTWQERLHTIVTFCLPLLFCWILGATVHYAKFGSSKKGQLLSHLLLTEVALTLAQSDIPSPPPFIKSILNLYEPVHKLMNDAKTTQMKYWITLIYYDIARLSLPILSTIYNEDEMNAQTREAFIEMLIRHPMKYLKNVAMHYIGLWQFWDLMTPANIRELSLFTETHSPLPYIGSIESLTPMYTLRLKLNTYTTWPSFLLFIRMVMFLIWMVTIYFFTYIFLCLLNKKQITAPVWAGLMGASLLQVTYLITSGINLGVFRYGIVMWPAVVFVGVTFLLLSQLNGYRKK